MYSSTPTHYQNFPPSPPPPPVNQPETETTGSSGPLYSENSKPPQKIQPKIRVPWSSGLFDCFSDVRNSCITIWCPCITFGQIAEIVDKGSSSCGVNGALYALIVCVVGCPCWYSCFYRSKLRQQHMLKDGPCCDCLVHCCCEPCALCQEYRELESRGYNLSIGRHANMERENREVAMTSMEPVAPVVESGMSR